MGYAGLRPGDPREIGPYQLLGQLGSGGMGQVFLGMSAGGRPIAVKVIRTELATDPEFRARFRREVAAAQKVSGLFTALVVDADLDSPMPWLATAYVSGPSLSEAVHGHGPLPAGTVLALAAGLAESLSAIHAAGVVHGDLKPSNVLLAEDGPRVIDFGISQAAEASVATSSNLMIGSPGFMSPEQILGSDISPASDIFSLGAVLTFAATGQGPFGSGSNVALMYRLVNSPASLGNVPGELRGLLGSCLAKHPGDRPTARELLDQVGEIEPSPGWLAESIISSFTQDRSVPGSAGGAGNILALTGAAHGQPEPGARGRHRISRSLASACLTGGLVAASAVAAFALIGAHRTPPARGIQPQAGAGVVATAPSSASSAPASPRASSSASPQATVAPSAYLTPSVSRLLSPSLTPAAATSLPSAAEPTQSSPQPSKSASSSASPATSPSGSPSASTSSSASPSASASSSPPSSTSPSPSASSPSSPSSSPPSTTTTTPPSSSAPSSPAVTGSASASAASS